MIDLSSLNRFVPHFHFQMEGLHCVKTLLRKGDYMRSIGLKDGYFSVPIQKSSQRFLRFIWGTKHYTFLSLPFSLSSAPRIFTKLLKPVAAFLKKQGYHIIRYLDDSLLLSSSKEEVLRLTQMTWSLLQSLVFLINWTISTLSPVQSITYLGFVISSLNMTIYLPEVKVQRVYALCNSALSQPQMSGRQLASLLGTLESCRLATWVAPLHLRALQILLIQTLRDHQFDYNCPVFFNPQSRAELTWWLNNLPKVNGSFVSPPPPDLAILVDVSMQGWGATCQGVSTNGKWSSQKSIQHINLLELKAAFLASKHSSRTSLTRLFY